MRFTARWIVAPLALFLALNTAPSAHAQAGRFIPLPRIPLPRAPLPRMPPGGGGSHIFPHIPIHGGGNGGDRRDGDNSVGWVILAILGTLVLVGGGWYLGRAIGGRLRPIPKNPNSSWPLEPTGWQAIAAPPMQDLILQPAEVAAKAEQTRRLMEFLAHQDRALDPGQLHQWIATTFRLVQQAWEARDYSSVRHLLLPGILAKHEGLLKDMRNSHEINRIDDLCIERLEFVHLHCPRSVEAHEATALITFRASVYFVADRTGALTRGSRGPNWFQEFWIFRRRGERWLLQDIQQSHESDRLECSNFAAELTQQQLENAQQAITI
jgi:hypothetical protein